MTQKELLEQEIKKLKNANLQDATAKAKKVFSYIFNQTAIEQIINEEQIVKEEAKKKYQKAIDSLINGTPLQYITKTQEFMGLEFYVDENVLIPQPDTEVLVEQALKILQDETKFENKKLKILDLCTGSGAIAVSIAYYLKKKKFINIIASDISKNAINIAQKNAIKNNVKDNIEFIHSNLFENLKGKKFDVICSNPPYIETDTIKKLSKEVQKEPKIALDGGQDGLDFYRNILSNAPKYLQPNGYLLLEIGYNQGNSVIKICREEKLEIVTKTPIKDYGGNDRVLIFKKR